MSAPKRVAAAQIFQEQNVMNVAPPPPPAPAGSASSATGFAFEGERQEDVDKLLDVMNEPQAKRMTARSLPLSRSRGLPPPRQAYGGAPSYQPTPPPRDQLKTSEELQLEKEPIQVRITGFLRWQRVIVPPNAYVVHTRLGRREPVTLGLGVSFRYNPNTDAFLVVPAAMQTIGVVANCISQEKQGINVLAYVQWQISDFSIAYRRLDFSDSRDPLSIVNAQLREQAEAAIKDKIATMSVEEVLTDKAPIIEELTRRLIAVAEGRVQSGDSLESETAEGLGIKIVTVQIKEAFVSSRRLWEHLQAPFRNEKEKTAEVSRLQMEDEIRARELENLRLAEISEAETQVEIERIKQAKQTEGLEVRTAEERKRYMQGQEAAREYLAVEEETTRLRLASEQRLEMERLLAEQMSALEQYRLDTERKGLEHEFLLLIQQQEQERLTALAEQELTRKRQVNSLELQMQDEAAQMRFVQAERELHVANLQQQVYNLINDNDLRRRLIERLPEIAEHMPSIEEMKVWQLGGGQDPMTTLLKRLMGFLDTIKADFEG